MFCPWKSSYQKARVGITLTGLTLPHCCACPKPEPGFPTSYIVVFFEWKRICAGCLSFVYTFFCVYVCEIRLSKGEGWDHINKINQPVPSQNLDFQRHISWSFLSGSESVQVVYLLFIHFFVYMFCPWKSSYQKARVGITLTRLTLPHCCACPKPEPGFPTSYIVVFFEWKRICAGCLSFVYTFFCVYVLPLEIQLSKGEGWDHINKINPTTLLCLSQARTWISNVIYRGLFWVEANLCRLFIFCLYIFLCICFALGNPVIKRRELGWH